MNQTTQTNSMPIFPHNYRNIDEINHKKNNMAEICKTYHQIVWIQQFYKLLGAITFKDR